MIKKLLSAALLTATISVNAQQVQNPGFENWTGVFPTSWGSFDEMLVGLAQANPGGTTQTTTAHSGTYAVLLTNQTVPLAGGVVGGAANTGPITFGGSGPVFGREAYASQPISYSFYYQYAPVSGDSGITQIILTKWNTGTNQRDTLAVGGSLIGGTVSVYTQKTVPINWLITGTNPDSVQLIFGSTKHSTSTAPLGTQMYVDDVTMDFSTGIQSNIANGFVGAYPNPASSAVTITSTHENAVNALVFDVTGRMVCSALLNNKTTKIDVSSFENGMYIYIVTDKNNNRLYAGKFNVTK